MENHGSSLKYLERILDESIYKILYVDLREDSYEIIKTREEELSAQRGFSQRLSRWLRNFADSGQVHQEDVALFRERTDLAYLRAHFASGKTKWSLSYRRRVGKNYEWVSMRMIRAEDYSEGHQTAVLFVTDDDSTESLELTNLARQQLHVLTSMTRMYVSMHVIDLESDYAFDLNDLSAGSTQIRKMPNIVELMKQMISARVTAEYLEEMLAFTDLTTLRERLRGKPVLKADFIGKSAGWCEGQFLPIDMDAHGNITRVLFSTRGIEEEKQKELALSRLSTELSLASSIQTNSLPSIFPAFPERKEFDLYASMTPAKEVGGDFYDFFCIDDDHFGFVIADVSGKGIPAALFMMVSKVLLNNQAMNNRNYSPAEVLSSINERLCKNNQAEMFVTVWLGILDVRTGVLTACNGGHEYPAIKRSNGAFELYRDRHGLVLGAMSGARYKEYAIQLEQGDQIFLYTDGVAEATDRENTLYGTERMLAALNKREKATCRELLETVRQDIEAFAADTPQFDDITMLALEYRCKPESVD